MSVQSVAKTLRGCVVESESWSVKTRRPASVDLGAFWSKWSSLMYRLAYAPKAAAAAYLGCDIRHVDEEFESAILTGLVRAAKKWNPDRAGFQTFSGWVVRQECQAEASRLTGLSRPNGDDRRVSVLRLDAPRPGGATLAETLPDREPFDRDSDEKSDLIAAVERAVAELGAGNPKREGTLARGYRMLREFAAGHTIALIAWREDIAPQRVRQIIENTRAAIHSRINFQGEAA